MHKRYSYRLVRCTVGSQAGKRRKRRMIGREMKRSLIKSVLLGLFLFVAGYLAAFWLNQAKWRPVVKAETMPVGEEESSGLWFGGRGLGGGGASELALVGEVRDTETIRKASGFVAAGTEQEWCIETLSVEKERCNYLVAIDPGHGGEDEGCSREGILEKDINLAISLCVETKLKALGYQVLLIRDWDTDVTLQERTKRANEAGADIYVSIHQNACEEKSSDISGIETWYNAAKGDAGSRRLARLLHSDLLLYSGANDRRVIEDGSLYVIRETKMPACLVETGFLSNKAEREKLITVEYQERLAEAVVSGIDLYFFPKTMYLTFDDGPTEENTNTVLDILKKYDIKATFFLIGENVEKHPETAKRIVAEGHTVGIHCYNHNYKALYESVDSYLEDFEKAWKVIYETTGVEVKLFRFPGGSINSYNKGVYGNIVSEMTERGYIYFDWNASLEDASKHNEPARLLRNAKESTLGRRRVVMLAHDSVYNTTQCLEELIAQFPEYKMLPLTEDVVPVQF